VAKKNKWAVGAAVIVVLAMFGSCNDDDSSSSSSTAARTTTVQVNDQDIWTGTVAAYPSSYSFSPEIHVDLGNGNIESVRLAHIGEPDCGNSSTSDQHRASLRGRVQQLLPLGARVTVVRGRELAGTDPRFTDEGFVFVEGAGTTTTTGPTPTSSSMSSSSTPRTTSDPTGATTSAVISTGASSAPATSTANSEELLVNEVLLAEGLATPDDPEIDLSAAASKTVEQQLYSGSSGLELEPNISYFDRLLQRTGSRGTAASGSWSTVERRKQKISLANSNGRNWTGFDAVLTGNLAPMTTIPASGDTTRTGTSRSIRRA